MPATAVRAAGLPVAAAALAAVALLSIAVGTESIPLATALRDLFDPGDSRAATIVQEARLPRTVLGLGVGAALGVAGALMQALTRNPLADPGLLGINAGAAAAVVGGIVLLGITQPAGYVWLAFAGAAVASVVVYLLGSSGRSAATPVRLALAGVALGAALTALTNAMVLSDVQLYDRYRLWLVGSFAGRDWSIVEQVAPFLVVGLVLALALVRPLNALALGDDAGRALGAHVGRTRALGALAITLLCGAAVAAAGPIAFVGLAVPQVARALAGPDQRWVLPYSLVLAPMLLLAADVLGRVVARPSEVPVAIVTAVLGAPVFIAIIRRRRVVRL